MNLPKKELQHGVNKLEARFYKGYTMGQKTIDEINNFTTFKFDENTNRVVNMRFQEETNIDEFLNIQNILDKDKVLYKFDKNFDIQVIS